MSYLNCEVAPAFTPGLFAVFVCGFEVYAEKFDLKKTAKKTEVTGTLSNYLGIVWEEYISGSLSGTFGFDSKWKISGAVLPSTVRVGAIYPVAAYVRRPGTNSPTDPGSAYTFNWLVEGSDLSFDPKTGIVEWKTNGQVTGPITEPA